MKRIILFLFLFSIIFTFSVYANDDKVLEYRSSITFSGSHTYNSQKPLNNSPWHITRIVYSDSSSVENLLITFYDVNGNSRFTRDLKYLQDSSVNIINVSYYTIKNISGSPFINDLYIYGTDSPPFSFIEIQSDLENYIFTYDFNKIPTFNKSDIKILNSKNEEFNFNSVVSGNSILISSLDLEPGIYTIKMNSVKSGTETISNIPDYQFVVLEKFNIIEILKDLENYKFIYKFNKKPSYSKEDIKVFNSKNEEIEFNVTVILNDLFITPINLVPDNYTIKINKIINDGEVLSNIIDLNFTYIEKFSFLEVHRNLDNYIFTYKFNKIPIFNKTDIRILNSKNEEFDFNAVVNENNILITPLDLAPYNYTIKIDSVKNGDEELTNIKDLKFTVKEKILELTSRDFGYYVLKNKNDFRLSFNKNILSADVKVLDSNDVELPFTKSFMYNNLFIEISEELQENKEYKIIIENASGENDYILKTSLEFKINTRSLIGDLTTDEILNSILNIFVEARYRGIIIVILAISIGVIFIIAKWLWNKLKQWLRKI